MICGQIFKAEWERLPKALNILIVEASTSVFVIQRMLLFVVIRLELKHEVYDWEPVRES